MNQDLQISLADNAKQWMALSISISVNEKAAFDRIHDDFLAKYGSNFMAHVYRDTFEHAMKNMPDAERNKLLVAFREAMDKALGEHYSTNPTMAQCLACHTRRP